MTVVQCIIIYSVHVFLSYIAMDTINIISMTVYNAVKHYTWYKLPIHTDHNQLAVYLCTANNIACILKRINHIEITKCYNSLE